MGASVIAYWPGVTENQIESQPGFYNDDKDKRPEATVILETYKRNANDIDPIDEEFIQDLNDVEAIANWAEEEGAERMTLEVNW